MRKVVWKLSDEEKSEIQDLYERKIALENLVKIINPDNKKLYDKLIVDYGRVCHEFQNWWNVMSTAHQWDGVNWSVDFDESEILASE